MKKIAIIGAGWAGLAAATELAPSAHVSLFEAGRVAGGRARAVASDDFSFVDNGQHLLIGAYGAVFDLMDKVGAARDELFFRQPLQWYLADGLRFQAASFLPAPLNVAAGILMADGASLREKLDLLRIMMKLQAWAKTDAADTSILNWLQQHNVAQKWIDEFWQPMVWGALNTPLDSASLRVLCNVMSDGVWAKREFSDYCVPRVDLTALLASPVLQYIQSFGGKWLPENRVGKLVLADNRVVVNDEVFDAVIVAVAPYHVNALLPENMGNSVRQAIESMSFHAITTVYLRYAEAFKLPALMTGFAHGTAQWLIDRSRLNGANEIAAVISLSDNISGSLKMGETSCGKAKTADDWAAVVHQDILRVCPNLGTPIAQRVITEKRATLASTVHRKLPEMTDLNAANIWLSGDWLHTRYPATLEAAVQSGRDVARQILGN